MKEKKIQDCTSNTKKKKQRVEFTALIGELLPVSCTFFKNLKRQKGGIDVTFLNEFWCWQPVQKWISNTRRHKPLVTSHQLQGQYCLNARRMEKK